MTQRTCYLAAAIGCLVLGAPRAEAQVVLLQDNFDSYANQAAFNTLWPATVGTGGTLSTTQAFSGAQSIRFIGDGTTTARNDRSFTATTPTAANPVSFQFEFFDSNGGAAAYRQISSLISGAGSASGELISLGLNNNIASNQYMARVLGFDGGTGSGAFFQLATTPTRTTGWHLLRVDISPTQMDFFVDGVHSSVVATGFTLRAYNSVRIGSGITATNDAFVDDALVRTLAAVPEPSSLALVGVAGFGLLARCFRRKA